jgi:uronate dehydrogenase
VSPRVLVTGAAGVVGRSLSDGLAERFSLRGLDVRSLDPSYPGEVVTGDCADPALALQAVDGVDAVVHLAGIAREAPLPAILHSHVETTAALLDAMVVHGVRRMVYASSNHAVGMAPRQDLLRAEVLPRPDTFYGVGKVAAEALLSLYADRYGISSVAIRIGTFLDRPASRRHLSTWLSPADCRRLVEAALTADFVGMRVVYGISGNRAAWWDLEPGRAIGYDPRDDASTYAADVPSLVDDDADAAHVGGPYATGRFDRRPFVDETE